MADGIVTIKTTITENNIGALVFHLKQWDRTQYPKIIRTFAKNVERRAKRSIRSGTRSGTKYPNLPNRSSRAGEPPAQQTGYLATSISSYAKRQGGIIRGEVGSPAPYSRALELGFSGRNLAPRPYLAPAVEKEMPILKKNLTTSLTTALSVMEHSY